jgi:hypothetical protein
MSLGWLAALQITGRRRSARPVTQSSSGIERSPGFPSPHVRNGSTADVSLQRGERQLRAISRLMRCNNVGAVSRLRGAGIQLIEQRLSFLQIARVKPFRKPAVDRSEKLAGLLLLALIAPQACEAGSRAQLKRPGLLAPRPRRESYGGALCRAAVASAKATWASLRSHDLSEQRAGVSDVPRCLPTLDRGEDRLQQRARIVGRTCLVP